MMRFRTFKCKMINMRRSLFTPCTRKQLIQQMLIFLLLILLLIWMNSSNKDKLASVNLSYVTVHLDLKGAPPKMDYLQKLLVELKSFGVNALLMEYEDMFPYEGFLRNISSPLHYTRHELKKFLIAANEMRFEIIPLVQTFGHLEFVLKLDQFKHLREELVYPDVICPSKFESTQVIQEMLKQVIQFHSSIVPLQHVHIGCDEVYSLNVCEECKLKMSADMYIFLDHVEFVRDIVIGFSPPGTKVLVWDDIMRKIQPKAWSQVKNNSNIEVVYWNYNPDINIKHSLLMFYHKHFQNIWIASAFKGADGAESVIPNFRNRVWNHFYWLNAIKNYKFGGESQVFDFKGIVLTGWSRYTHLSPICDLLPLSLPSLFASLMLVKKFMEGIPDFSFDYEFVDPFIKGVVKDMNAHLQCDTIEKPATCKHQLLNPLYVQVLQFNGHIDDILNRLSRQDMEVNSRYEYTNIRELEFYLDNFKDEMNKLAKAELNARNSMAKVYESRVIDEYIGFKKDLVYKLIDQQIKHIDTILNKQAWSRDRNWNHNRSNITLEEMLKTRNKVLAKIKPKKRQINE